MKKMLLGLAAALALPMWADTTSVMIYQAVLSPTNENPPVTDARTTGDATILLRALRDDSGFLLRAYMDFLIDASVPDEESFVAMHIHRGAVGVNGPVVIDSKFGSTVALQGTHRIWRQVTIEDRTQLETVEALIANPSVFYVNLHTNSHRGGIFRGNLEPADIMAAQSLEWRVIALTATVDNLKRLVEALAIRAGILAPVR